MVKYARIPYSVNDSPEHRQLALETARKSIVLLKNEGNTLPLSKSLKTIAVIGPDADDAEVLLGNYNGDPTAPVTPLAGIRRKAGRADQSALRARQRPGRQPAQLRDDSRLGALYVRRRRAPQRA